MFHINKTTRGELIIWARSRRGPLCKFARQTNGASPHYECSVEITRCSFFSQDKQVGFIYLLWISCWRRLVFIEFISEEIWISYQVQVLFGRILRSWSYDLQFVGREMRFTQNFCDHLCFFVCWHIVLGGGGTSSRLWKSDLRRSRAWDLIGAVV